MVALKQLDQTNDFQLFYYKLNMSSSGDSNSSIEGNQTTDDSIVCCYYVSKLSIKKINLKRLFYVL